jgi:hypothetical protein
MLCCIWFPLLAAEPEPLQETLKQTQAVGYMRVTKLSEELRNNTVQQVVTFVLCGQSAGLGDLKELEITYNKPAKAEKDVLEVSGPVFTVGSRCVLLLTVKEEHQEIVAWLKINDEGKFVTEGIGEDIGLKPNLKADAVVQLIASKIKKTDRASSNRPKPPPTARNQPWNLMRSSPLRRVWPFFPR